MAIVCIDAGHYGRTNHSPVNDEYYESLMTWDLHKLLRAALEDRGVEVITTRDDQTKDLAVVKRGQASKGCDMFISLHSNAASNKDGTPYAGLYVSAIHQIGNSDYATKSKDFAETVGDAAYKCMGLNYAKVYSKAGSSGKDYYGVLRGAASVRVPGLILECGFHTNYCTTVWLSDPANLAALADAVARSIAKCLGVPEFIPGDLNDDGVIDESDVQIMKSIIQGATPVDAALLQRGDLNGDGKIDIRDYTLLRRKILLGLK